VTLADANLQIYNNTANNWAGIGADGGGNMWFRTGLSGTPMAAMVIDTQQQVHILAATASTSPTTGALTVAGGVGVGGKLFTADAIYPTGRVSFLDNSGIQWGDGTTALIGNATTHAQYFYTGNVQRVNIADAGVTIAPTTASTSPTTGALTVAGGVGVSLDIRLGGTLVASGAVYSGNSGATGYYNFGNTGTKYLNYDGTQFNFVGGGVLHGSYGGLAAAPLMAGSQTTGVWPVSIGATDRGIIYVAGSASNIYGYFCQGSTSNVVGSITGTTTATIYNTASSAELKEDLKSFNAGSIIDDTKVYDFAWKSTGERSYGVIAQQAIDVYPLAVTHMQMPEAEGGEYWGVDYSKYVPVILQELKALRARVRELEGGLEGKPS
jgi:hypothetical protein